MVSHATANSLRQLGERLAARLKGLRGRPSREAPSRAEVGGPLDAVNDDFHDNYQVARTRARREVPVFVVLADDLVLFHDDRRIAWSFSPRAFHVIKSVVHGPVALYAAFEREEGAQLDPMQAHRLSALREKVECAGARLDQDAAGLDTQTRDDLRGVLDACLELLRMPYREATRQRLDDFARALGPTLLRLADVATQLQLDALHLHVEEALRALPAAALRDLQVVVAGDHQARARSLAMQYFQKRLGEPPEAERRVTYAEGVSDERAALALVGTRELDRTLARAFFGEERRLQRDVLGDSARERLAKLEVQGIGS